MFVMKEGTNLANQFQVSKWIIESAGKAVVNAIRNHSPFSMKDLITAEIRTQCNISQDLQMQAVEVQY